MATKWFQNNDQVRRAFMPKIESCVDYILERIAELNEETIQKIVYGKYDPSFYERTMQFKYAWSSENEGISGKHVRGKFYYDPSKLEYNPALGQHGNYQGDESVAEYLADIIYQGLTRDKAHAFGNGEWGKWASPRNAWKKLIDTIGKAKMQQWVREGMSREGVIVTRSKQ